MKVKKFQEGGQAPAPAAAPQAGGPEEQLMQMAQQILQQFLCHFIYKNDLYS